MHGGLSVIVGYIRISPGTYQRLCDIRLAVRFPDQIVGGDCHLQWGAAAHAFQVGIGPSPDQQFDDGWVAASGGGTEQWGVVVVILDIQLVLVLSVFRNRLL